MTHYDIDFSKSPAPKHDAVEEIKKWLGNAKYNELSPQMAAVTNPRQFSFYCMLAGIQGFPVSAWYELYHGEGSWEKAWKELEEDE